MVVPSERTATVLVTVVRGGRGINKFAARSPAQISGFQPTPFHLLVFATKVKGRKTAHTLAHPVSVSGRDHCLSEIGIKAASSPGSEVGTPGQGD